MYAHGRLGVMAMLVDVFNLWVLMRLPSEFTKRPFK